LQKVKQTNKHTQPPQVFPLTITRKLITIVNCIHKQGISKTNISQYEFFSQPNQKAKQETDSLPHPPSPTSPIADIPKTIARQTTVYAKMSKAHKINQTPQRKPH